MSALPCAPVPARCEVCRYRSWETPTCSLGTPQTYCKPPSLLSWDPPHTHQGPPELTGDPPHTHWGLPSSRGEHDSLPVPPGPLQIPLLAPPGFGGRHTGHTTPPWAPQNPPTTPPQTTPRDTALPPALPKPPQTPQNTTPPLHHNTPLFPAAFRGVSPSLPPVLPLGGLQSRCRGGPCAQLWGLGPLGGASRGVPPLGEAEDDGDAPQHRVLLLQPRNPPAQGVSVARSRHAQGEHGTLLHCRGGTGGSGGRG